jgi:DMSO/TMAO reductase YedYZ molybdopterin-dependent catalytic subunit
VATADRIRRAQSRRRDFRTVAPLALVICIFRFATPLLAQPTKVELTVSGDVAKPLVLNDADLAAFGEQTVNVTDEKGNAASYSGVPVAAILAKAGAPLGKDLRGQNMAVGVVARASDGYHVLFALTDFDPDFSDRTVMLVDRRDGEPLDDREGPLRLVVPREKRHARWVRGITSLDVVKVH